MVQFKLRLFTIFLANSGMPEEEIMKLNLPTGIPFLYEFDRDVRPIVSMRFLSDKETVERAMAKVASIGKGSDC